MNPTLHILKTARILCELGWSKGDGYGDTAKGTCCAIGAIGWAAHPAKARGAGFPALLDLDARAPGEREAVDALYAALPEKDKNGCVGFNKRMCVEQFNDASEKGDILALYGRAIEAVS
jgi:hypothetical protein